MKVSRPKKIRKPCYILNYCPYGPLVEEFELRYERDGEISCGVFGNDCPVFTCAEEFTEESWLKGQNMRISWAQGQRVMISD